MKRLVLLACFGLAQLAHAQPDRGAYVGAGFGVFDYDEGGDAFALVDSTSAYQIFGGYRFNDHLAVEFGLGRTGDLKGAFDESIPGFGPVTFEVAAGYDIYAAKLLGLWPLDRFSLFGGIGYYSASLGGVVRVRGVGNVGWLDGHERGGTASAGVQYDFRLDLRSMSIRGEYQWFDFGRGVAAQGLNIGMLYRF